jgi:hypothetical protein
VTGVREDLSVEELAGLVCSTLERHGVRVVLSGGSVVSIYSDNAYQSYDLDFIQTGLARTTNAAMEELGFTKQGRHWLHPHTTFLVEFPPGPVQVGDAIITEFFLREVGKIDGAERRSGWRGVLQRRGARERHRNYVRLDLSSWRAGNEIAQPLLKPPAGTRGARRWRICVRRS